MAKSGKLRCYAHKRASDLNAIDLLWTEIPDS